MISVMVMQIQKKKLLGTAAVLLIAAVLIVGTVAVVWMQSVQPEISVCIDAGHGAHDSGAVNGERLEKDDNLRLALSVREKLEAKNIKVYMTREDDTFLSLDERCRVANKKKCTLFVALHRNSAESGNGVEMWIQSTPTDTDWALAENMLNALSDAGISKARGVKTGYAKNADGNYYVNAHTDMPSCLAEIGFVTSEQDNELFDKNLDAYAAAIADGIEKTLRDMGKLPAETDEA